MLGWIDTHCHLDAAEFKADVDAVRARARAAGVRVCVIAAVDGARSGTARAVAHRLGDAYALGIHPLYVAQAQDEDLARLDAALAERGGDPRLIAAGEIGLDYFVEGVRGAPLGEKQEFFFREQLKLARKHGLPVLLHARGALALDAALKSLREIEAPGGIAHAFSGSAQQARQLIGLGFRLGFGGAFTHERATRLRRLAAELPATAIVMETDAPDMPPRWLYAIARQRAVGCPQGRNEPAELPRIGAQLAALRGLSPQEWAGITTANALAALPRLKEVERLAPGV
ncbi:MAG: TatD family hydrolase [Burkholderiaceae bacterium]|jgi:TatD DNase family protein|nr:TatD family hydrolase [Burkholderiaceae bacterium]